MIKIVEYLMYVKNVATFKMVLAELNKKYNLQCQNEARVPLGSVTGMGMEKDGRTLKILGVIGPIIDTGLQKSVIEDLIKQENIHREVYEFIDCEGKADLIREAFPEICGSAEFYEFGYEVNFWNEYPKERKEESATVKCPICDKDFEVVGKKDELYGTNLQCPMCRETFTTAANTPIPFNRRRTP